jgi:hypothetical protein
MLRIELEAADLGHDPVGRFYFFDGSLTIAADCGRYSAENWLLAPMRWVR